MVAGLAVGVVIMPASDHLINVTNRAEINRSSESTRNTQNTYRAIVWRIYVRGVDAFRIVSTQNASSLPARIRTRLTEGVGIRTRLTEGRRLWERRRGPALLAWSRRRGVLRSR